MRRVLRLLLGQAVIALLALVLMFVVLSPWPGAMKLTGGLLCPDGQPEAVVVEAYQQRHGSGTATRASLFCMGPRGDVTEVGSWIPLGVLLLLTWLALQALVLPLLVLSAVRRRRRSDAGGGGLAASIG